MTTKAANLAPTARMMTGEVMGEIYTCTKSNSGTDGRLEISDMLSLLEDHTFDCIEDMGYGQYKLLERGMLWVIGNINLELKRMPDRDEELIIQTWFNNDSHMLYPCNHLIKTQSGELLAKAVVLWTLMDERTRAMLKSENCEVHFDGISLDDELKTKSPRSLPLTNARLIEVPNSFLDVNNHMNNKKYFELAQAVLKKELDSASQIRARFIGEAREHDQLMLCWGRQENRAYFETQLDGKANFKLEIITQGDF